jgi:hypothetical protein
MCTFFNLIKFDLRKKKPLLVLLALKLAKLAMQEETLINSHLILKIISI